MIAITARLCFDAFESLFASLKEDDTEAQRLSLSELPSHKLADIYDRFKLWDHAFGARNGHLDRTMRDSGLVQDFVIQILRRLNKVLQEGLAERAPYGNGLQEILMEIQSFVNCLFDMGPALQTPEPYGTQDVDASQFEFYGGADIQHAIFRLPKAPQHLLEKFAKANVKRRHRLQAIRKQHEVSVGQTLHEVAAEDFVSQPASSYQVASSTVPSEYFDINFDYSQSESEAGSGSSYTSSLNEKDASNRRVPPPPNAVFEQTPFQCSICFKFQTKITSRPAWKYAIFYT